MFEWLRRMLSRRCEYYKTCRFAKEDSSYCAKGPTYFDGIEVKSGCGEYRKLDGWEY